MPLRFSLTAHNLTNSYGSYVPAGGSEPSTVNKILRRVNFGAEVLLHRNVNLMIGYNYLVHQELKLEKRGASPEFHLDFQREYAHSNSFLAAVPMLLEMPITLLHFQRI